MKNDALTLDVIRRMPKVLLHDHLDGGLRPATVVELAEKEGVELPTRDPQGVADWFYRGASRGNLGLYLEGFAVTIGCLQTAEALERVACEAIEDVARDGVVYLEIRFAPFFHTQKGLPLEGVMEAVLAGLARGKAKTGVEYGLIVCGMRNMSPELSLEMAELAVNFRDRGAVGFDLAGDEAGHPPKRHLEAFQYCQRKNFNLTIHAGEAFGKESIWQALQFCGAHRIGHCTRLSDDLAVSAKNEVVLGELANYIRDKRVPLEMCLSSNVHTGAVTRIEHHPFGYFYSKKFRVTLNTDNRLMSNVTLSDEMDLAVRHFGLGLDELEKLNINAMKSAFIHYDERCDLIYRVIKPGYRKLREELRAQAAPGAVAARA